MEFLLLGPLEVVFDGRPARLGGRQRRTVLAILAVQAGRSVSTERLVDELWGESPPAAGRKTVQAHIAHLRRELGGDGGEDVIRPTDTGYVLSPEAVEIDIHRFEKLVEEARLLSDPGPAVTRFDEALALFRGDPLEGLADLAFSLRVEAARLEELRLAAHEDRLESLIEAGRADQAVPEAKKLLSDHPLRERMWAMLMLSLYRSGRQGDALRAFSTARRTLTEELGIEPSAELRSLEQRILDQDPSLEVGPEAAAFAVPDSRPPAAQHRAPEIEGGRTGTVTFLFTDVEESTRLWEREPAQAAALLAGHEAQLRSVVADRGGQVFKGTGDGVMAVFGSAVDAVAAAIDIQLGLHQNPDGVRARVAIHTGEAEMHHGDYYGVALNICQRVLVAAHGGQILLTEATSAVLSRPLPASTSLIDLGHHRLRGISSTVQISQVGHPELPTVFPSLSTGEAPAGQLPIQLTSFVGRQTELAEVCDLLPRSRLLTLTGVGGGGKSRLAIQVAQQLSELFAGGVWFVDLASVIEPALVSSTIAQALGVQDDPGRAALEAAAARLRDAQALLVLDDCEHLVEACAEACDHLLRAAPDVTIMATSRERLGVQGETAFVLEPMTAPHKNEADESVRRHDSVELFAQRATLALPNFRLTADNTAGVGRICRAVDGIPLAVELAAAKVSSLTVEQICSRLGKHLDLLGSRTRTGTARRQTMIATLDWSYQLLAPTEKTVLAQLTVFRGGFDLAQAEAVCRLEGPGDLLEPIEGLLAKSLVSRDPETGRFGLLEPVRRYAAEKLADGGGTDEVARRHALAMADMVEEGARELKGKDEGMWLDRFELEHANLLAALRWSLDNESTELALRIAGATWGFWKLRGHLEKGRSWLEQVLGLSHGAEPEVLFRVLRGAGDLAASQGDRVRAASYLGRALQLADELDDDSGAAAALTGLAGLPHRSGDLGEATVLFEQALARARRGSDPDRVAHVLASLALLSEDQGRISDADAYVTEALEVRARSENPYVITDVLLAHGEISINRGAFGDGRTAITEALQMGRDVGLADITAWATAYLGKLALSQNDAEAGQVHLDEALAMFRQLDMPVGTAWAMRHLGEAARAGSNVDRARKLLQGAVGLSLIHVRPDAPLALQALADLEFQAGHWNRAAVLLAAAASARQDMGLELPEGDHKALAEVSMTLRARLGPDAWERLSAHGRSMTLDEAGVFASAAQES